MHAQIGTVKDPELRVQIVSERSTFDENPAEFHKKYAEKQVRRGFSYLQGTQWYVLSVDCCWRSNAYAFG
jgi:hypothetical protein